MNPKFRSVIIFFSYIFALSFIGNLLMHSQIQTTKIPHGINTIKSDQITVNFKNEQNTNILGIYSISNKYIDFKSKDGDNIIQIGCYINNHENAKFIHYTKNEVVENGYILTFTDEEEIYIINVDVSDDIKITIEGDAGNIYTSIRNTDIGGETIYYNNNNSVSQSTLGSNKTFESNKWFSLNNNERVSLLCYSNGLMHNKIKNNNLITYYTEKSITFNLVSNSIEETISLSNYLPNYTNVHFSSLSKITLPVLLIYSKILLTIGNSISHRTVSNIIVFLLYLILILPCFSYFSYIVKKNLEELLHNKKNNQPSGNIVNIMLQSFMVNYIMVVYIKSKLLISIQRMCIYTKDQSDIFRYISSIFNIPLKSHYLFRINISFIILFCIFGAIYIFQKKEDDNIISVFFISLFLSRMMNISDIIVISCTHVISKYIEKDDLDNMSIEKDDTLNVTM